MSTLRSPRRTPITAVVVDVDFADPQMLRLNSPAGSLPAWAEDRDALAARLKGARRLRAEQSSKAVQGAQRWRIEDTSFQQQDQEGDAVLASEQSAHSPLRQGRLGMPVRPTASPRESFRKPRKRNDGSDSLLSRVALPGLNEMQRTWWPVRSTPLPLRGAVAMSPYGATVSSARPPASPRPSIRRPSTGGRKKQGLHDGLFTRGDRPLNDDLFRHSSRASHKNEPSPAAVAQTYPPGYTPSQMPAKRRPVTAPLLQRRRAFVETHIMEHAEPGDAGVNVAVSHDSGSAGDDRDSTLSESDRHVKLSWAHGLAGDFERARQSAQDAINADAHNATGYLRLAVALKELKNWSGSAAAIKRGLELDADEARFHDCNREIQVGLLKDSASLLIKAGQPEEAIAELSRALALPEAGKEDMYWMLTQRSRLYMSQNDAISAADDAADCIKINQRVVEGYERHCDALVGIGDLDAARACAQVGMIHAPNHWNDNLGNLLERIMQGSMPRVSISRVFVKQLLRHEASDISRILQKWDKRMKKEWSDRAVEHWKNQIKLSVPGGEPDVQAVVAAAPKPLGSFRAAAMSISRRNMVTSALTGAALSAHAQKDADHNASFRRTDSVATSTVSADMDIRDRVQHVMVICKECFKFSDAKNRELFLRLAVCGWNYIRPLAKAENQLAQAGLELKVGFAHLESMQYVLDPQDYKEERSCRTAFEHALELLGDDDEHGLQRAAARFGLAQMYKVRREGVRIENLMSSAEHLRHSLSVVSFETDPKRFIAVHHEMGDLYIEAGDVESANRCLVVARTHLDTGGVGWNTLSGIKFLKAQTLCKLAEACHKSCQQMDGERDSEYRRVVDEGIRHYQAALQVLVLHLYPLEYARTSVRLCHLRVLSATNSTLSADGILCLHQGQRSKLLEAFTDLQDPLHCAEAVSIAMLLRDADEPKAAVDLDEILSILSECFSGCVEASVRLGMYAQALAYAERARGYAVLTQLLKEDCRMELLKGLPPSIHSDFMQLCSKLRKHRKAFRLDVASTNNSSGMLQDSVKMIALLNDMASHADSCSSSKLRLLGMMVTKVKPRPCVWMEDPVQDCETAFLEFYMSDKCAFAFVKCWKQDCPRAIEYTLDQVSKITAAAQAVKMPATEEQDDCFMASLEAVSAAIKVDTVLAAIPPFVKRLILVPHGPLLAVPMHLLPLSNLAQRLAPCEQTGESCPPPESRGQRWLGQELCMDRFPFGVVYTSSINLFTWAQQAPIDARFAPMLQCLTVGRPRGAKSVPHKDTFDCEIRCFRHIFKKMRAAQDVEASQDLITGDTQSLAQEEADAQSPSALGKTSVTTHSADVLHWSCYSVTRTDARCDKMDLELQLAGKSSPGVPQPPPLDTSQVCRWSLPVCRLVTLASNVQVHEQRFSAKMGLQHTGSAGPHLGWLIAGASAVVSSAWYIEHECKTVFFAKLYETMTMAGLDIGEALHATQCWLRSATLLDYVRGWPKDWQSISWSDRLQALEEEERATRARGQEPLRPFASPFWWAGFSVWGDSNASGKHAETKAKKEGGYNYDKVIQNYVAENDDGGGSPASARARSPVLTQAQTDVMTDFFKGIAPRANINARG